MNNKIGTKLEQNKKHIEKAVFHIEESIKELKKVNSHFQDYSYYIKCLKEVLSADNAETGLLNIYTKFS
jgi:hypothetical protein